MQILIMIIWSFVIRATPLKKTFTGIGGLIIGIIVVSAVHYIGIMSSQEGVMLINTK